MTVGDHIALDSAEGVDCGVAAATGVAHLDLGVGDSPSQRVAQQVCVGPPPAGVIVKPGDTVAEADDFDGGSRGGFLERDKLSSSAN